MYSELPEPEAQLRCGIDINIIGQGQVMKTTTILRL
jgi:hypothetical protein